MSNFFYRRLNFFNKSGAPINFDYIGPTGSTPLDRKFFYFTGVTASTSGASDFSNFDADPGKMYLNITDNNGSNIQEWAEEIDDYISQGAEVYVNGRVLYGAGFKAKVSSINKFPSYYEINFQNGKISGQSIISPGEQVQITSTYNLRPGGYYKGNIYFDPVSSGLYENEQIFIVQELYNTSTSEYEYGLPHTGITGSSSPKWRTRWYNDNYGETDVTEIIFTYRIDENLSGGDGQPLIVSYPNLVFPVEASSSDTLTGNGYVSTNSVSSEALSINVALNSSELTANIYERKLIVEDISNGVSDPIKVLEIDFYGEITGEDERFSTLLDNLGRAFYNSDSIILRDHDPEEPLPNYNEINEKRKELLVAGEEIFPYIGSYKGLINAIKFFGYQDLRIKEYWLNLSYQKATSESSILSNQLFLDSIKAQSLKNGYGQSYQVNDILDNPNSGKYMLTQTYGPNEEGEYVLNIQSEDTLVPSRSLKKTSLFGLFYDLNKVTDDVDDYGYPVVQDAFKFTQEEVLIKLFALKERLKRDYLPLNARIIDITGEGVYFEVYNLKSWTDKMVRMDVNSGLHFSIKSNPDFGFIEDLRNFSIRPNSNSIQTPSSYYNEYNPQVQVLGGTGSAIFMTGIPATGPNPTISVISGDTYNFTIGTTGFSFYLTTDSTLATVVAPYGVTNNGATGGYTLSWYVNPSQTSPVYYFCPENKSLINGVINVTPSLISDLGNITDPLDNGQNYNPEQNQSMVTAISNFYDLKQNGQIVELGDGKYDPPSFIDPDTGLEYKVPIGMPIVLEMVTDRWTWDELNISWDALDLPVFKVGDQVKITDINSYAYGTYGTITAISYSTGVYDVLLDSFPATEQYYQSDLYSPNQNFSLFTWDNIDFSNIFEIEWIIDKNPTQSGSPYHFEFRGSIVDYYRFSHFVPYTGTYKVTCNVYDAFNFKSTVIEDSLITVSPKTIDLDAWTRYRENETYTWDTTYKTWDDYNSIWEYPAEGMTTSELQKKAPNEIFNFSTYGNKAEEGQDVYVKVKTDPIGSTGSFKISQSFPIVTDISSYESTSPGQYGFATITTFTNHNLNNGDDVSVIGTIPELSGRWTAIVSPGATNSFRIPTTIQNGWSGVQLLTTPNRISVNTTTYPNQYISPVGNISVSINGSVIGYAESGDSLYLTSNAIVSSINSLKTYPDYFASCTSPSSNPSEIIIYAPDELGDQQNGVSMGVTVDGSISLISSSTQLDYGVSPSETYVYWQESDKTYPNENLKYWGTKNLVWNIFNETSWDNLYSHSWFDFEFNNDWLGGYEIHSVRPGDNITVSPSDRVSPIPIGVTLGTGISGLTVQEVADQMNSAEDPYITNFYYRPIPTESGNLPIDSPPINLDIDSFTISNSAYSNPGSLV